MKKSILFLPIVALLLSSCGGTSKDADKPSSYSNNSSGEVHKHTFATEWTYDSSKHWHSANCGHDLKKDEENHVWNNQVINPSYDTVGYTLHTCAVCGYSYKDSEVEKLKVTITWENYDKTILATEKYNYNDTPSYKGATPTKERNEQYSYVFSGWTPNISPATADKTYTATFVANLEKYKIDFDLNGGTSSSYAGSKLVESLTKDDFFFDCVKEGLNFRGWAYEGTKVFDQKGNLLFNPTMVESMTFKAIFAQDAYLTIVSNLNGAATITGEGAYAYNSYVDVSVTTNRGYVFVGWYDYSSNILLSNQETYKYMMWSEDVTLQAKFKYDTYVMSVKSSNPLFGSVMIKGDITYQEESSKTFDYLSSVTISAYTKTEDFRFLGWFNESGALVETNAVYTFTMPYNDYNLYARWDVPGYQVLVFINDDSLGSVTGSDTYVLGSKVTLTATPIGDNVFKGWYSDSEMTSLLSSSNPYTFTLESEGLNIYAKFFTKAEEREEELAVKFATRPVLSENGKTIKYGLYPQKYVKDSSLISSLNALTTPELNGWYLFNDDYYAKVNTTRMCKFDDGTHIEEGKLCWFKCEPIVWRVLSNDNGEYYLLSTRILDAYRYTESYSNPDSDGIYANNYEHSGIRKWLNGGFYRLAFALGNSHIQITTVDNSAATTDSTINSYACNNTNDKVFLPSYQDYINSSYGFSTSVNYHDSRFCKPTDWAKARGVQQHVDYFDNGGYWTRSPSSNTFGVWISNYYGSLVTTTYGEYDIGARPAITIKID